MNERHNSCKWSWCVETESMFVQESEHLYRQPTFQNINVVYEIHQRALPKGRIIVAIHAYSGAYVRKKNVINIAFVHNEICVLTFLACGGCLE